MAESAKPLQGQVVKPPLLETVLAEQQCLTAVDKFSQAHDQGFSAEQGKYYKDLIPGVLPGQGQQFAFEVDLDACTGCKACVTGCHNLNGLDGGETWRAVGLIHGESEPKNLFRPATLTGIGLYPENLSKENPPSQTAACKTPSVKRSDPPVERLQGYAQYNPSLRTYFQQNITTACHHCADPSCLNGCPVRAYEKDSVTGIVKHLADQCIGCKYCIFTCSYGVPQYNENLGIVRKCDMCADRLKEGEAPACVQSCPNEAIRVKIVDINEVHSNPVKYFQIPSSPDPNYSKPTTRYVTKREIPQGVLAADHALIQPQPSETPLVFTLVLTQISVGLLGIPFVLSQLTNGMKLEPPFQMAHSLSALLFGIVGLAISLLHLGRPLYAFRAFLGLRTSWLSREVIALGFFVKLAAGYTLLCWLPTLNQWMTAQMPVLFPPANSHALFLTVTVLMGTAGVFSSGMIYKDTPRIGWNSWQTVAKFILTGILLGSAGTLTLLQILGSGEQTYWLSSIFFAALTLKLVLEGTIFLYLREETDHPLRKTAHLLKNMFGKWTALRYSSAVAGGLFFLIRDLLPAYSFLSLLAFSLLLTGECIERHLFFRAVVPPKMPGHVTKV